MRVLKKESQGPVGCEINPAMIVAVFERDCGCAVWLRGRVGAMELHTPLAEILEVVKPRVLHTLLPDEHFGVQHPRMVGRVHVHADAIVETKRAGNAPTVALRLIDGRELVVLEDSNVD